MSKLILFFGVFALMWGGCHSVPKDDISARQAFRKDLERHPEKATFYLGSQDAEIRRYTLYLTAKQKGAEAKFTYMTFLNDDNEQVRMTALMALMKFCKNDADVQEKLGELAAKDKSRMVAKLAAEAAWPFHRDVLLLRNDPNWDHEVQVVKRFQIPDDKWKFKLDPRGAGHTARFKWYVEKLDEADWAPIKLGEWESQGYDYDGYAWYRIRFTMPEKIECNAVELAFTAVDESAWCWLNGVYLGAHDIGPSGWNTPFALDCRKEIRWGEENLLIVRVLDTAMDGGIFKPVFVEILK